LKQEEKQTEWQQEEKGQTDRITQMKTGRENGRKRKICGNKKTDKAKR
jgi:hypothetical protein